MSKPWKVKMGQELTAINGEPLRMGGDFGLDPRTSSIIVRDVLAAVSMPAETVKALNDKMNSVLGKPLTLYEAVSTALLSPYEDEKNLGGSERAKRQILALRLYRTGMAKLNEDDVKYIVPLVEKFYRGSLIAPQVEALLRGREFKTGLVEGDEADEPAAAS